MDPDTATGAACFDSEMERLWADTLQDFYDEIKATQQQKNDVQAPVDPSAWLGAFRRARHPDGRLEKVYGRIHGHLVSIQLAVGVLCFGAQAASTAFPAASPAVLVANSLAWVFESFAKVSHDFDRIENFFALLAAKFGDLKVLDPVFRAGAGSSRLREPVKALFSACLRIFAIAIKDPKHRFKKWIKTLKGDDDLDEALSDFTAANARLLETIGMSSYAETIRTGQRVEHLASAAERIEFRLQRRMTSAEQRNAILDWLSPLNPATTYNALSDRVSDQPNAGSWLLGSAAFKSWKAGDNDDKLWYSGKPGAGKSVLATIVIRHLLEFAAESPQQGGANVAFLYLSYKNEPKMEHLLGSLCRQIVSRYESFDSLPAVVKDVINRCRNNGGYRDPNDLASKSELVQMLSAFASQSTLFIVVDALDECPGNTRKELMSKLRAIKNRTKLLVTSRLIEGFEDLSDQFKRGIIEANGDDVDGYIDTILQGSSLLRKREQEIKDAIRHKSQGMFLLARLHMDTLSGIENDAKLLKALKELPQSVEESYQNAFDRIRQKVGDRRRFALNIMAWVAYAFRPLSLQEIRAAVALSAVRDDESLEEAMFPSADLSALCCGLVVTDEAKVVRFVHYSAQGYFFKARDSLFENYHVVASLACARCVCLLSSESRDSDRLSLCTDDKHEGLPPPEYFASYAAEFMHRHYRHIRHHGVEFAVERPGMAGPDGKAPVATHLDVVNTIRTFLEKPSLRAYYFRLLRIEGLYEKEDALCYRLDLGYSEGESSSGSEEKHANYGAWEDDNDNIIVLDETDDDRGTDCDAPDGDMEGGGGGEEDQEGEEEEEDKEEDKADNDADKGHCDSDADNDSRGGTTDYDSSDDGGFYGHKRNGSQETYDDSEDAASDNDDGKASTLHLASFIGCSVLVESLMADGCDVDSLDSIGQSALTIALKNSFDDIAASLVNHGARVDLSRGEGHMLLLFAAQENLQETVAKVVAGVSPAEEMWATRVLRILLMVPLLVLLHLGGIVLKNPGLGSLRGRILSEHRQRKYRVAVESDPDRMRGLGLCLSAAYRGEADVLSWLVPMVGIVAGDETTAGEAVFGKSEFLRTACFLAVENVHTAAVEILLDEGVSANSRNYCGQTLLHRATARNNTGLVRLLLARGADVHGKNAARRTALMANASNDHVEVLELLLSHGASLHEFSKRHKVHEIYRAAVHGRTEVVRFFLEHGVDPSTYGVNGWTPLHGAAANGHVSCVELLVKHGAKVSPISDTGKTPLDFVLDGKTHYDWFLLEDLGESWQECSEHRRLHEDFHDMERRRDWIQIMLRRAGSKTSKELYDEMGEEEFNYGPGGMYTHEYWEGRHRDKIDALAASKREA